MLLLDDMELSQPMTHDRLIKAMVGNVEEPLLVSRVARQSDLLSTALGRFGLSKVDKGEIGPVNWITVSAL